MAPGVFPVPLSLIIMTPTKIQPRPIKGLLLAMLLGVAVLGTGCFRVSSSTQALREAALENLDGFWEERIEFSAGRLTFAAAQFGSRFVELPPEARAILGSAKGAEVSLWESPEGRSLDGAKLLKEADRKMEEEGWTRIVGVIEEGNIVGVYIPEKLSSTRNVQVTVLVVSERQVVCAAARSDIEPLMKLAMTKMKEHGPLAAAR